MKFVNQLFFIIAITLLMWSCQNNLDRNGMESEVLKTLPDNFYAYRRGNIYISNGENLIWFNKNILGNIKSIWEITSNTKTLKQHLYSKQDSINLLNNAQEFIRLSKKYKFGHILVDRAKKISFSYIDGLPEEYVIPLNDSVKKIYLQNKSFIRLSNGWFEYKDK